MNGKQPLLKVHEVAELLSCAESTVYRAIAAGELEAARLFGRKRATWRIQPQAVQRMLKEHTKEPA